VSRENNANNILTAHARDKMMKCDINLFTNFLRIRLNMSSNFDALFDLHFWIVCRISFFIIRNVNFETTLKQLKLDMSIKLISIVFEKKRSERNRVSNSKLVVISRILIATSRHEKFDIFNVSLNLWSRVLAQRIKR
jgi:hypothetical protein